jgi:hypothetical protein
VIAQDLPELPRIEAGQPSPISGWVFTDDQVVEMTNALAAAENLQHRYALRGQKVEELEALISVLEIRLANEALWRAQSLALAEDYKKLGGGNTVDMIIVGVAAFTGGYWFNEIAKSGDTNIVVPQIDGDLGDWFDAEGFVLEVP